MQELWDYWKWTLLDSTCLIDFFGAVSVAILTICLVAALAWVVVLVVL